MEMVDLLTLVQKELSNLNADINTLRKAKKEVRDYRGEQKDKYMCKRCFEEKKKEKKMLWDGSYCQKVPFKSGKRKGTEKLRESFVSSHGKPQYCIYCQTRNVNILKTCGNGGVVKCCSKNVSKEALQKP